MENTVSIIEDDAVLELESITIDEDGDTDAVMGRTKALRPRRDAGH